MSKQALTITILTFITVLGWIGFEIFHSSTTTTIDPEYKNIKTIDDFLDEKTLDDVEARQSYELYNPFEIE